MTDKTDSRTPSRVGKELFYAWDGNNKMHCVVSCDLARTLERENADLRDRIGQFDSCIQAVATALGGVCCGGVDGDQTDPHSTTQVLVGAITDLREQLAEVLRDENMPVKYVKHGGIIYAIYGTSSIDAYDDLAKRNADLEEIAHDAEVCAIEHTAATLKLREQLAECQKECKEQARLNGIGASREAALMAQLAAARGRVVEECAKVCEGLTVPGATGQWDVVMQNVARAGCAAAIRALAEPQEAQQNADGRESTNQDFRERDNKCSDLPATSAPNLTVPITCNSPFERVPQHATDPGFGEVPPESNVLPIKSIPYTPPAPDDTSSVMAVDAKAVAWAYGSLMLRQAHKESTEANKMMTDLSTAVMRVGIAASKEQK